MKKDDWAVSLVFLVPMAVLWIGFALQAFGPGTLFIVSLAVGGAMLIWNNYRQDRNDREVRRMLDELSRKIEASK